MAYEKYGMQSDIEYFKARMEYDNYRFGIKAVGGHIKKHDRIKRIIPKAADGRWYLPDINLYTEYTGRAYDLTKVFVSDEWMAFPYGKHDDILDCMSRIFDVNPVFPQTKDVEMLTRKEKAIMKMLKDQQTVTDGEYDPLWHYN